MDIKKVIELVTSAFNMPSTPLTPIPPPLLLTGAGSRSGLSARNVASRIISRQSEAGAPVGPLTDGSANISEAMEVIRVEEIINALITEAKIEIIVPPGVPVSTAGANIAGPVISQGATTSYGQGSGVIR
jgi:hypothetical protein